MLKLDSFVIEGGARLKGTVRISGSKNASLPCLFATLLTDEDCVLENVPGLQDIRTAVALLRQLQPSISIAWIERHVPYTPRAMPHFLDGMRKAGIE